MVYRAIGIMSGSSMDGLDIVYAELDESGGQWSYDIKAAETLAYSDHWLQQLGGAVHLPAFGYLRLDAAYGHYIGQMVNDFIARHGLEHKVQLICSHGHTVFHAPEKQFTAQLGQGAAIAAVTGINVVSDVRAMDIALGGQGAPIVPVGEKLLFGHYNWLLNIGGIANLSCRLPAGYLAFDVCAANKVLNMLAAQLGQAYDDGGRIAAAGTVHTPLLTRLDALDYYQKAAPKSLDNGFGTGVVWPLIASAGLPVQDALCTYTVHIAAQVSNSIKELLRLHAPVTGKELLVTGGGALNTYLVQQLQEALEPAGITVVLPANEVIQYKEALIMAMLGILRWREEDTALASATGASRNSIGGAVWMGQEA